MRRIQKQTAIVGREAGKPVMIQNPEAIILEQDEELFARPLIFENAYDAGTSLWFTGYEYNALMKMDKKSHRVEWKGTFPDEPFLKEHLYSSTASCGGKLYFAPYWAKEIAEYDLKTETIRKLSLRMPRKKNAVYYENGRFIRVASIGKKVYFIPAHYPGILCYDTEQDLIRCLDDWVDRIEELRTGESWYFTEFELAGDKLILPCACADAIVIFDIIKEKSQVLRTPPTDYACKFCGICRSGDSFYLVSEDGTVSKRKADSVEEEIKRWKIPISGLNEIELYPMRYAGDSVYLFPNGNRCAYRIDIKTDEGKPVMDLSGEKELAGCNFLFLSALWDGSRFYLSMGNGRRFLEYETDSKRKWEYKLFLSDRDQKLLREQRERDLGNRMRKEPVAENGIDTLRALLDMLKMSDTPQRENDVKRGLENGRKIYRAF